MNDEPLQIDGGVAVITGAASGIGAGLVRHALSLGMRVVAADVVADKLRASVAGLDGEVIAVPTDVTRPASVDALADAAWRAFGQVDLLFNNAGIMATGFSWQIEAARWQRLLDVNIGGTVNGIRSFVPHLLGAGRAAQIINTSSVGGFLASPLMAPYSATKFAIVALTESLRSEMEMLQAPIGVSLLAPGPVITGIFDDPFGATVDAASEGFVAQMRTMTQQYGVTPDVFAARVFTSLRRREFWIVPQPEALDDALRAKTDGILARRNPTLPAW
ncbi:SDR family NAD(P)-dependent oxidoreductase [Solimonas terrae]|uniref:SDR family NAD(P)-dependent oxidoreductase n=1 Tax=Solimonas terrae TaxID=1396819 RepID=A0A6M2BTY4_9GAMM|nr:SDR family NAD(P)-dependent oxidoreductase [Solimonas terrae]NGY05695.1 SDR family NAD(P)-dependent oxidoreductase [Solimonas terrae]